MRFGSIHFFRRPIMNYKQIATRLRLEPETVRKTVLRFEERGYDFSKMGRSLPRYKSFTPRLTRHLLSQRLLEHWSGYSIAERVEIIQEVWDVKISKSSLLKFYLHHKVGFLTAKVRYRYAQLNRPYLNARRKQFALTLGNLIASNRAICYMDETTFNV